YPLAVLADLLGMQGDMFGLASGLLGLYLISRGFGLEDRIDGAVDRVLSGLYAGRVTLVTYLVAGVLFLIGSVSGYQNLQNVQAAGGPLSVIEVIAAVIAGSIRWFAAAGVTSSLGRVTDEYLAGTFEWKHLNAPFYILSITGILHAVSVYFLEYADLSYLAMMLTAGTLLGLASTLAFAVAESRLGERGEAV
ncbi:MAG: DUF373 family protein, partial [Halapricum sp.]